MTDNEKTKNQTYSQQVFHKFFDVRQRSSSFSGGISSEKQPGSMENRPNKLNNQHLLRDNTTMSSSENREEDHVEQAGPTLVQTKLGWQQDKVPGKKRKRNDSPNENNKNTTVKRLNYKTANKSSSDKLHSYAVPVQNQFDILSDEQPASQKPKEYVPRPEPIFVTGIVTIAPLRDLLQKVTDLNNFTMTTLKSGHIIKLMPKDIDTYKVIRDNLIENNINHFTYKLKSERSYRVVVRGLHASEDISMIKEAIETNGHKVKQIVNVLHRATKEKLPLFFVDLEQQANNKDIFKLKFIGHIKVTVEAPYKKKEVLQCKRCQRFGHSKNQCFRPFRCVKCGNDHPTSSCTKPPETDATCANCDGKHPASYKGCAKYKQYKEKILNLKPIQDQTKKKSPMTNMPLKSNDNNKPPDNKKSSSETSETITYAEITKSHNPHKFYYQNQTSHPHDNTYELSQHDITKLLDTMFYKFQHIMKDMIDSMMDRMIQLITSLVSQRA
ncbi:unnamed protein product [Euphydryas editha]|uniref:Pre-C2HC domain-containing protein n=1 Tax=Euphydryas editha TaxID=104508 RepID=A0AAU9ULS2_EUPED|nr:unnamed protein product [Euphydryas editha]